MILEHFQEKLVFALFEQNCLLSKKLFPFSLAQIVVPRTEKSDKLGYLGKFEPVQFTSARSFPDHLTNIGSQNEYSRFF
jgi:hypothetical protein